MLYVDNSRLESSLSSAREVALLYWLTFPLLLAVASMMASPLSCAHAHIRFGLSKVFTAFWFGFWSTDKQEKKVTKCISLEFCAPQGQIRAQAGSINYMLLQLHLWPPVSSKVFTIGANALEWIFRIYRVEDAWNYLDDHDFITMGLPGCVECPTNRVHP